MQTIVMPAQNPGMKVIAEDVETQAQIEQLKKLNCESAQGFFFSKPMSFEHLQVFPGTQIKPNILQNPFDEISIVSTIQ